MTTYRLPDAPIHLSVDFVATQLVCGYYDYDQAAQLEFVPEVEWITNAGSAKFLRDRLIVTYCSASSNSYRAEFPYRIIQAILTSTNPPSLTLTLWEPPRIFEVDTQPVGDFIEAFRVLQFFQGNSSDAPKPITHRLVALPDGSRTHEDVIGQCLVYQIRVRPEDFNYKIQNLHDIDLPITSHNLPRRSLSNSSFAEGMRAFHGTIQDLVTLLTFDILFQVQGLVQNGYLLPWTGKNLLVRLFQDSQESKAGTHSDRSNGTRKVSSIPSPGSVPGSICLAETRDHGTGYQEAFLPDSISRARDPRIRIWR